MMKIHSSLDHSILRQSTDAELRIELQDSWQLLLDKKGRYDNESPRLECHLQGITCYIDTPYHSEHYDETIESSVQQHLFFNAFYAS